MPRPLPFTLRVSALWVFYCTWASATGWILSYFHQLHRLGYAIAALPAVLLLAGWWFSDRSHFPRKQSWHIQTLRLKKLPSFGAWAAVTVFILLSGILHPPSNYDGLTYRLPRLLYWLQENHWFWINGIDFRLDIAGTGFEWMSAPLLLATGSDRGLFLLNYVPFLLLPGLFFLAACGLGVRPRSARWWMWVWPLAFGIAMQAASIGNDMVCAGLALASLAFAAEAKRGRPVFCLTLSALAAILMTGVKVTTLPLGLPLAIFWIWQAWQCLGFRQIVLISGSVTPAAVLCSFLPIAWICWQHTGAWNANPGNRLAIEPANPVAGFVGNTMNFGLGSLYPPLFPGVGTIESGLTKALEQKPWFLWVRDHYPAFSVGINHELPSEEAAGIGLGITLIALVWCVAAVRHPVKSGRPRNHLGTVFTLGTLLAFLVILAKIGGNSTPRLLLPFTPFLLLGLLLAFPPLRKMPSDGWSLVPALFLLPTLLLNPNRPLIPLTPLAALPGVPSGLRQRVFEVYDSYARRNELLATLRNRLPRDVPVSFGGGGDQSALSLFKPLGHRKVYDLSPAREPLADWVVGTRIGIERRMGTSLENWENGRYRRVFEDKIASKVSFGPEPWYIFHRVP
jgi:hypothetical protein